MKKELIVGKHVLSSTNVLFSSIPYQQFIYSLFLKKKKQNPEVLVQSSLYFQAFDKFKKREN